MFNRTDRHADRRSNNSRRYTSRSTRRQPRHIASRHQRHAEYNGWKNWETWNIALWFDNDEGSYNMVRDWAIESNKDTDTLADMIKDYVDEENPLSNSPSFYSDILQSGLDEADFYEIAKHFLDQIDDE